MPRSDPRSSRPPHHLRRGLLALTGAAVLVIALPVWLWNTVGWPLPHAVPSLTQLRDAVLHESMPDEVILNGLAVLTWLAWAQFAACLVVEARAALQGRPPGHVPLAAWGTQALAARLVAAALMLVPLATPMRPAMAAPLRVTHPIEGSRAPSATDTGTRPPPRHDPAPGGQAVTRHVVQPHDTLWDLAERYFGDGRRFREIFDRNHGRPQADGHHLTNPNRIRPGWILTIPHTPTTTAPPAAPASPASPAPAAPAAQEPPPASPRTDRQPDQAAPPASTPPGPNRQPAAPAGPPPTATSSAPPDVDGPATPTSGPQVELPSGSIVGLALAAAISAAVTLAWLHQRRSRHLQPPHPSVADSHPLLTPTVRRLLRAHRNAKAAADHSPPPAQPPPPPRGLGITIGHRHGHAVIVDLAAAGPLGLDGDHADAALRAIVTTLLATATGTVRLLIAGAALHHRLLGDSPPPPAVTVTGDLDDALATLELEVLHRTRLLDHHDLDDLDAYANFDEAEPLPTLVLVADHTQPRPGARLPAVLAMGRRLGVTAIVRGTAPTGATIRLDPAATVTAVDPPGTLPDLAGTRLYTLTADDANQLTSVLAAATGTPPPPPPPSPAQPATPSDADDPDRELDPDGPAASATPSRPVNVHLLGPPTIRVAGQELTAGLRRKARELLALLLLRPAGVTRDAAIDALWPDTDPARAHEYFKVVLGNLRQELRPPDLPGVTAVERSGDRYRANPAIIDCDLWRFHQGLTNANQTQDPARKTAALTAALTAVGGELLDGEDQDWALTAREELRRQACDTAGALAELHEQAGQPGQALTVLEQAAGWDPYNEELHQRIMRLQAGLGRPDAVRRTLQRLQARLEDDLGVDLSDPTLQLARQLLTPPPVSDQPNHVIPIRPHKPPHHP